MVRRPDSIPVKSPGLEVFVGKITDKADVFRAASGCDIIIHTAANTNQNTTRYADYKEVNVNGTEYILQAAEKYHISRTIIISSANTLGYGTQGIPGNESCAMSYPFTKSYYAKSKQEAEELALYAAGNTTGDIIIINPSFMIGAYDTKPGSGKIIIRGYKKKIIFVPPGGKNFIHVKDAAKAICNAIIFGRDKERYLLANENMSYKDFYTILNNITQSKAQIVTLPSFILHAVGFIGSTLSLVGLKTALHNNNMRILCIKNYYSNQKAKEELKLDLTPIPDAIKDALQWFKTSGMLAS